MALSRLAHELAAEIAFHDWSDAPYRVDKAGHRREHDTGPKRSRNVLEEDQEARVRTNVMFVVGQVLGHAGLIEPKDIAEWAETCGVQVRGGKPRSVPAFVHFGFRWTDAQGETFAPPAGSVGERDFVEAQKLLNHGPWTAADLDDQTLVELDRAYQLVNAWTKANMLDRDTTDLRSSGGEWSSGSGAHWSRYMHESRQDFESPDPARWIYLGELRRWFSHHMDHNGFDDDLGRN